MENITNLIQLPSLQFVQNQTYNLIKLVGNKMKNQIYQYTNWNISSFSRSNSSLALLSSSSYEENIVKYFASNIKKIDSPTSKISYLISLLTFNQLF